MNPACSPASADRGAALGLRYSRPRRRGSFRQPEWEWWMPDPARIWARISWADRQMRPSSQLQGPAPAPPSSGTARPSSHHGPRRPGPRPGMACASRAPYRHQGRERPRSRHGTCHHPATKAHSPDAQSHDPHADTSHRPAIRGDLQEKETSGQCMASNRIHSA